MSAESADWSRLLESPCDPFYVHIDERGKSVTLGFHTRDLPVDAPAEWQERGFNAFEFYLVLEGVEGLRVTGWDAVAARNIEMTVREEFVEMLLGSPESGIAFRAATARLARTRAYLASDGI
ncbi:Imm50 family immunity protein [Streptomyces sp. NPDC086787]|uniref:Imm50 family immunity protein n=1 Tax=Streptomyces sp. NPDC086787 TaxID=3365759 RepID=UPI0037FEFCDF